MSRTYTFSASALYGGRGPRNMYLQGFSSWNTKRVGWFKDGSTDYAGAVSIYFDLSSVYGKTIESIKLTPQCSGSFEYSVPILYNQKSTASTTDWSIPSYAYEVQCPRYGVIPELDVTAYGIPEHYAYVLGGYYRTYSYVDVTGATLTVVTSETSKTITYNANGGTNAPSATVLWGENSWDGYLTSSVPTRTGYSFAGWNTQSNGSGTAYASGAYIQISANITLYAQWTALKSVLSGATNANITENTTVTWTNYGSFTNKLRFIFGSVDSGEISVSGSSHTYTLPSTWFAQIPNATSGTATVYLYTYVNGTLIGTSSRTFTAYVKSTVVPSINNPTATGVNLKWGLYLQKYSSVTISVTGGVAGTGASIKSYSITGPGINYSTQTTATSASASSSLFTVEGTKTYTVTITDTRGRTAQKTVSVSCTEYSEPSITSVTGVRCNSDGTVNQTTGTSIKATSVFTWTAVGQNSLTRTLSYKKHTASSYTTAQTGISSGASYVIAVGLAEISSSYDVKVEISDSLGNSASYVAIVPPIVGIAFGLKNDRARFGGPVEKAGFQVDWDAEFNGVLTVTKLRSYNTLPSYGWYRITSCSQSGSMVRVSIGVGSSQTIDFNVFLASSSNVQIVYDNVDVPSDTTFDQIRVHLGGGKFHIDIHKATYSTISARVDLTPFGNARTGGVLTPAGFTSVVDSPSGETELAVVAVSKNVPISSPTSLITSGTIANSTTFSYTATQTCWFYYTPVLQAGTSGGFEVSLNGVVLASYTSGEAIGVNVAVIPVPMQKGDVLDITQNSNRTSSYRVLTMRGVS